MRWRSSSLLVGIFMLGLSNVLSGSVKKTIGNSLLDSSSEDEGSTRVYHGRIPEDATGNTEVDFSPNNPIKARDRRRFVGDKVCGYTIYKKQSDLPFRIEVTNEHSGQAKIFLNEGHKLDYERRKNYKFEIAPHDCETGRHAVRELVHIHVLDVNEHPPKLDQKSFLVEVREGEMVDEILRLRATDADGSDEYSAICHYHIWTEDVPFKIDSDGILYNTEALDYSKRHNYILETVVQDCGGLVSEKVMINIKVVEACKAGWKDFAERMEYTPGSAQKLLGPQSMLEKCDATCHESTVSTRIFLTTKHIGKGCDRDTYSIQSQRKLCGASAGSVDLLPSPALEDLTEQLPTDDGQEADRIFAFNGVTNAIEIPTSKFNHTLDNHFTISTWMKHEQNPEDKTRKGAKEHILCNSDGEKMNRHHYSLFVHNCRLVFLLRQEPRGKDLNVFKPAEWRWKIPQVCDGQWHHYAISVNLPQQVHLYIDGKLFVIAKNNPEVIDDWPIHPSKKVHFTKMVVGACWQGGQKHLSQYFKGYLAGLSVLRGKTESDRVIRCLNDCKEKLDFHAMSEMESGMSVAFNSEMTEITINGRNKSEVEHLLRRVGYINTRMFPTPGHRNIRLETDVTCSDGRKLSVPTLNSMIIVAQAEKPIIRITGATSVARSEKNFTRGVKIFKDVMITSETRKEREEMGTKGMENELFKDVASNRYRLDSCMIKAEKSSLDFDVEHLKIPTNLLTDLGLQYVNNDDGLIITGTDTIANYMEVISSIQYVHRRPENINTRNFKLTCSELNGRFVSNSLFVTLEAIHTVKHATVPQAHAEQNRLFAPQPVKGGKITTLRLDQESNSNALYKGPSKSNMGVMLIVVVCVGFLLFMIVLGVIRIRAAHQKTRVVNVDEKPEMEWDNSALTITVNPMEQEEAYGEPNELNALNGSDSETDDDDDDDAHYDPVDDLESSEEETGKVKDRELEWDDSTLSY